MAWTPPSDAVEATVAPSVGGWTPPADAVVAEAAPAPKLSLIEMAKQSSKQAAASNIER